MAIFLYVTFLQGARAQLQLLTREVGNLRCSSAVNRIKYCYFYHQSCYKSTSAADSDSGVSEDVQRTHTGTVGKSKDFQKKGQQVSNDHNDHNTGVKLLHEQHELHNLYSRGKDSTNERKSSFHSKKKKKKTATQYFTQSWLNYYNAATEKALTSGTQKQLQTKPQQKEVGEKIRGKHKSENTFGALRMEIDNESERPDERNPNERIDEQIPEDTDERRDHRLDIPLSRYGRLNRKSFYYNRKMALLGREGKIKEAIAVFEDWMMVQDRVMPSKRTFVTLIGILGRVGYAKKAFELFGKMKQLGLDPEDHIYTSLFNVCANSPSPAEGLQRAEYLLNHMRENHVLPNLFTVKAAMKALALCGDFSRVFSLLDEAATRLRPDIECFNHLFMACISDQEAGFTRALQVWQKMGQYRIQPNTFSFNLLLRSARDCGIGDPNTFASALGLDSLDVELDEGPGLLQSVSHSLDERHGEKKSLSMSRSVFITGGTKQSDPKLEVIGTKMNIYSSFKLEQRDSSISCKAAPVNMKEQNVKSDVASPKHVNKPEVTLDTCDRSLPSRNRVGHTVAEVHRLPGQVSGKDLPHFANDARVVCEQGSEKYFNVSNSQLSAADSDQTKCVDSPESLYLELLTEDTISSLLESRHSKICLKDLKLPSGRLALLGGARKLVSFMEAVRAQPDLKTFTQILACLPNDEQSEFELLSLMEERGVKPDIDFLNDIMMRRNRRKKSDTVKAVLKVVSKLRLIPNMRTYAAIALTCHKEEEAHKLLQDMKEANLEPNTVIMEHLIYISRSNFTYKLNMLKTLEALGLKATQANIVVIEKSIAVTKKNIIEAEKRKDPTSYYLSESFQRSFQYFLRYYKVWLTRTELDKPRHPWDAFKPSPNPKQEREQLATVN